MLRIIPFLLLIFILCGCSTSKKSIITNALDSIPQISGSVLNAAAFSKGGTLALGSFKAGTGAVADDETDQLSALIINGIKDTLLKVNSPFVVQSDNQGQPDLFLDGYIDNYGNDVRDTHLKLRKNQVLLSVDGDIWLRDTGEKVVTFQSSIVIDTKTQNSKSVAYQMGVGIAQYIGSLKE